MAIRDRFTSAWNAFTSQASGKIQQEASATGAGSYYSPGPARRVYRYGNEKSIIPSILTRISIDASEVPMYHADVDDNGRFLSQIVSGLNRCLTLEANVDQAATAFRRDFIYSMLSSGYVAIVPVDTTDDPDEGMVGSFDILTMRVGRITSWYPRHVRVDLYNENTGLHEEVVLPKSTVAIIENPLYTVMNEPNSTLKRLQYKLSQLDAFDEKATSGKLDMLVQLPYTIRTETKREQANKRRKDLEDQLEGSQYGIGYIDAAEKITQLNRPLDNRLQDQVEYLTNLLYGQLGITAEVMNGTADEATMLNYYNRTINPILNAGVEAMRRVFLTKTARTQKQSVVWIRNTFAYVTMKDLSDMANSFSRNEILTANEIRGIIGYKPSADPKADQLVNSNMPQPNNGSTGPPVDGSFVDSQQ